MLKKKNKYILIYNQEGVAALLIIVIISVATLIMAYNASLLGLGELEAGYSFQKGGQALAIAEACGEETLRRFKLDTNHTGGTLNLNGGSCIINITSNSNNRIIDILSEIENYYKKIEIDIDLNGNSIIINNWREIDT